MARILAARNGRVQNSPPMIKRCWVGGDDPLMLAYHDEEWGVPVHDDRACSGSSYSTASRPGLRGGRILPNAPPLFWGLAGFTPRPVPPTRPPETAPRSADPRHLAH